MPGPTDRPKIKVRVTRGEGAGEYFLARLRGLTADRLIPSSLRQGRILDIGCGRYPLFLASTEFAEKYGLDNMQGRPREFATGEDLIRMADFDIGGRGRLPFEDGFFHVVTMLAVVEHIEPAALAPRVREIHRVLKSGGLLIVTTPAFWTGRLLRVLAALGMLSREEIDEHKHLYRPAELRALLRSGGFKGADIRCGFFEAFLNTWAVAAKEPAVRDRHR